MSNPQNVEDNPPNAEDNRRIIVERFWQRMREAVGVIPVRVIGFMDLLQLSASNGLTEVRDWGASVYNDISEEGMALFDEAVLRGSMTRSRFEVFGRHENNMQDFRLTSAETSSINAIATMVRERGIMYFIGEGEPTLPVDAPPTPSLAELQASLSRRLNDYFNAKPEYFGRNAFNNVRINVTPDQPPDQIKVRLRCVGCPYSIGCTKVGNKNWHISNYTAHVKMKHKPRRDGVYNNTRSHLQLPDNDGTDSESVLGEETFTSSSCTGGDENSSTGSTHRSEEGVCSEVSEDTEADTIAEQVTVDLSGAEAATNERRQSVADLVNIFSAGPSTSKSSKN